MIDILQVTDPGCCGGRRLDEDGCCVACGRDFFDPDTGEEAGDGTRSLAGNPDSPQVVVFLATIVDVTVGS